MKSVVQRVSSASVTVDGQIVSTIGKGFLLLVGLTHNDTDESLTWMARKVASLRIFEDSEDKMNLSLADVGGEILAVSQFTLYADIIKGRRPAFISAAPPEQAVKLFDQFCSLLESESVPVKRGIFRAKMEVSLVNDGPVTILIESPPPAVSSK